QGAAVAYLPFVVDLGEDGAGQAEEGGRVGEHADHVGTSFDFLVDPLERVGGPDLLPVRGGEGSEGGDVVAGVAQHRLDLGELAAEHAGDDLELGADAGLVGLGEDGADRGGDHLLTALG